MKKIVHAIGFLLIFFSCSALAQNGVQPARKITVSMHTTSAAAPVSTSSVDSSNMPMLKAAQALSPVDATVIAIEPLLSRPSRPRLEYSEDQIAIVGLAADSSELTRTVMTDPRLVRVEALRGEGDNAPKRLYRQSVDFSFVIFNDDVVDIRILKPRWDGSKWMFDLLAQTRLE